MEFHWLLPPPGTIKINVHDVTLIIPFMNGNTNGIGMVVRNSNGGFKKLSLGNISNLSPLHNQLWATQHGLNRAFEEDYRDIVVETDNLEAFLILKNFPYDVPEEVAGTAGQILIKLHDPIWRCSTVYVYPQRNKIATYLARLGGERCDRIYTFSRPIGCVEELMCLDLGFGPLEDRFLDVVVPNDQPDPVNFGSIHLNGLMHAGYEFQEDAFLVDNGSGESPVVVEVHNIIDGDLIVGADFVEDFLGDIPA